MNTTYRKIAGFMSAESIYSLAFYIVMVAAIAGVGAGIMSKSAAAKGVTTLSVVRANYQAEVSLLGYGTAPPAAAEMAALSGGLLDAVGAMAGVGRFVIINQPTAATPSRFAINVVGVSNPDVCTALVSTGYGSWAAVGLAPAALSVGGTIPASSALISANGTVTAGTFGATKLTAKTLCADIGRTPDTTAMAFVSN